uniref:Uncharacterized protein n=1 Tax=Timema cristinae TaxID=61476 RepID=A0A7R9D4Q6_TIMCR|nr:unnamed protein product [Timema cristinae]
MEGWVRASQTTVVTSHLSEQGFGTSVAPTRVDDVIPKPDEGVFAETCHMCMGKCTSIYVEGKCKTTLSTSGLDLNIHLPIIGSLVYCESSALDHVATEDSSPDLSHHRETRLDEQDVESAHSPMREARDDI